MWVAWFSDRGSNPDIYITSTTDGSDWGPPVRVTTSADGDFNPSLFQDAQGTFHLTWFRWSAPFVGHIWYNSSPDGRTWNQSNEIQVTTEPNVDDWVPTMTQAADGRLLIYFVSEAREPANPTSEMYVASKRPSDPAWNVPAALSGLNSATEHDHLPFAARTGSQITLVWVRHDQSEALPWLNHKSDLYYATSTDGLAWSAPAKITEEAGAVVNLFPALYPKIDGNWAMVWLSTRPGAPTVFELPLTGAGQYPNGVVTNSSLPAGYSHRIAPTSTPGVYLGVWVQGPEGSQDLYYRFFAQ